MYGWILRQLQFDSNIERYGSNSRKVVCNRYFPQV